MPRLRIQNVELELDAVLFDAGGTLVRLDYGFLRERARRRGQALSDESLARGEAVVRRAIDRRAREAGGVRDRDADRVAGYFGAVLESAGLAREWLDAIAAEAAEEHARANLWRVALPGAASTLAALRAQGFRTGVISNADGRVAGLLAAAGLAPHLEAILDSHLEGVEKPDPEIFRRALERLGVAAERTAYVGDIYAIDAVGARGAGLVPVVIDETGGYGELDCARIAALAELLG